VAIVPEPDNGLRFQFISAATVKNVVFPYVPPYSLVELILRGRLLSPSSGH
jgi:hypothetical protein